LLPVGYVLTFWRYGFPELGAGGLGIASALMMWGQAIGFALYLSRSKRFADLGLFTRFERPHGATLKQLLATGLPIGVTVAMEGSLFIVTALLIGRLGPVSSAAHQIAINVASLAFMIPLGLAEATTVRVGHALGRGDRAGLRRAAFAGYALLLLTQTVSASIMVGGNHAIVGLYTRDTAAAALAASLLLYAAAFQFPDGVQVVSAGSLRGLKDTRVPMLLAALAYWGIGMPVGATLGFGLGGFTPALGPRGMWTGLIAGLVVAAVLLCARFLRSSRRIPVTPPEGTMTSGA
jgi:MATE family multidrug resistance protein